MQLDLRSQFLKGLPELSSDERCDSKLDALRAEIMTLSNTQNNPGGFDLRPFLERANSIAPGLQYDTLPADCTRATTEQAANLLSEIGRRIFLPFGELLAVDFTGAFRVCTGSINLGSLKSFEYLGQEIQVADAKIESSAGPSLGITLNNVALIDRGAVYHDSEGMLQGIRSGYNEPFGHELLEYLEKHNVSKDDYYWIAGYNRIRCEEIQRAKDAIYTSLRLNAPWPLRFFDRGVELLKPTSKWRLLLDPKKDTPEQHFLDATIRRHLAITSGALTAVDTYQLKNLTKPAMIAFLDFLCRQELRARARPSQTAGARFLQWSAADVFFKAVEELHPEASSRERAAKVILQGSDDYERLTHGLRILNNVYEIDFWNDVERAKNLL